MRSNWLSTLLAVATLLSIGAFSIFSGAYSVAATNPHGRMTRWILSTAAAQSIRMHAKKDKGLDLPDDDASLRNGYSAYESKCVPCHGAPGVSPDWMGKGMHPRPPDLRQSASVRKPEEIYWVIKNGIKDSGMPALGPSHDDRDIRELTAFVVRLGHMSASDYDRFHNDHGGRARNTGVPEHEL
jgi:mono/diheme cytochrome c family protein